MKAFSIIILCLSIVTYSCKSNKEKHNIFLEDKNVETLLLEAIQYYNSNSYSKALKVFDEIIHMDTTIGKAYYSRAYCWAMKEKYDKSNEDYIKSISLKYKIEESYFNLGCNYATMRNDSLALIFFENALKLNSQNEEAKEQIIFLKNKLKLIEL